MFFGVRALPPGLVPNFKTTATADEDDLAFQVEPLAEIVREEESTLLVGGAMLRLGMKLPQIDARIARRNVGVILRRGADTLKFLRRHHEKELAVRFRDDDELLGRAIPPPARRDGNTVFVIELMTKFSGVET